MGIDAANTPNFWNWPASRPCRICATAIPPTLRREAMAKANGKHKLMRGRPPTEKIVLHGGSNTPKSCRFRSAIDAPAGRKLADNATDLPLFAGLPDLTAQSDGHERRPPRDHRSPTLARPTAVGAEQCLRVRPHAGDGHSQRHAAIRFRTAASSSIPTAAIAHARRMVAEGADFIDIGAESDPPLWRHEAGERRTMRWSA